MKEPVATITGRTASEPEPLRYLNDGTAVTSVRVAVTKSVPDGNGGWTDVRTTWYAIGWFGQAAEHVSELGIGKGDLLRVTGEQWLEEYTRRDGTTGTALKVRADGTPRVWPKRDRADGAPAGRAARTITDTPAPAAAPAPPAENTGTGGGHDDPPF